MTTHNVPRCEAETCPNWAGFGCVCDALGLDRPRLCEQCLTPLTADDIGTQCTDCWETWRAYKDEQADWEVAE